VSRKPPRTMLSAPGEVQSPSARQDVQMKRMVAAAIAYALRPPGSPTLAFPEVTIDEIVAEQAALDQPFAPRGDWNKTIEPILQGLFRPAGRRKWKVQKFSEHETMGQAEYSIFDYAARMYNKKLYLAASGTKSNVLSELMEIREAAMALQDSLMSLSPLAAAYFTAFDPIDDVADAPIGAALQDRYSAAFSDIHRDHSQELTRLGNAVANYSPHIAPPSDDHVAPSTREQKFVRAGAARLACIIGNAAGYGHEALEREVRRRDKVATGGEGRRWAAGRTPDFWLAEWCATRWPALAQKPAGQSKAFLNFVSEMHHFATGRCSGGPGLGTIRRAITAAVIRTAKNEVSPSLRSNSRC
jgi:hypothetical protein